MLWSSFPWNEIGEQFGGKEDEQMNQCDNDMGTKDTDNLEQSLSGTVQQCANDRHCSWTGIFSE